MDSIPPTQRDFRSNAELYPGRDFGQSVLLAYGVSFHTAVQDSERTRMRFKALRSKRIALMELSAPLGRMKKTEAAYARTHVTVWFKVGAEPHRGFHREAKVV